MVEPPFFNSSFVFFLSWLAACVACFERLSLGCVRACTLDEWCAWIKLQYYPTTDISTVWVQLTQEEELSDQFADYSDDVFKAALDAIVSRARGPLKSFCGALISGWERHLKPDQTAAASQGIILLLAFVLCVAFAVVLI